jgi:hypothetical protein
LQRHPNGAEVDPIEKVRIADICGSAFSVVDAVDPFLCSTLVHIDHRSLDLDLFIWELIRAETEIGLTGIYEAFSSVSIAVEVQRQQWF